MATIIDPKSCKAGCTFYDVQGNMCRHPTLSTPRPVITPQNYCSMFTPLGNLSIASCKWKGVDVVDGAPGRNCTKSACPNTPLCSQYELAAKLCRDCAKWNKDNVKATLRKNIYAGQCPSAYSPHGGWSYEDETCKSFAPKPITAAATCGNCDWWKENKNLGRMQSIKGAVVAIGDCASPNSSCTQSPADHICPQHKSKTAKKEICGNCRWGTPVHNKLQVLCERKGKGTYMQRFDIEQNECESGWEPKELKQTCETCGWWGPEESLFLSEAKLCHSNDPDSSDASRKGASCSNWKSRDNGPTYIITDAPKPKPCTRCETLTTNNFTIKFDNKFRKLCERCQASFLWMMA